MNYVEVAVPFFVLAMAVEFVYGFLAKHQSYRLSDTVNSLQLGTISRLNDVLRLGFAGVVFGGITKFIAWPQWSMQPAWQWAAAFVAYDFCYYWKHRYGHQWRIMWASHIAHHQSEEFNLSTALRQTGTDYLGFVFYIPLYVAGIPAAAIITVGSLNLIYQFWVHTEHIRRLGPLEWLLVTPSNHRVHHARNPEYIDKNYGGVFIVWDRMFGTFRDERKEIPCVYGITTGLNSWNPVWANVHFWYDTAKLAARTKRWRDKIVIWFKPPAWVPADLIALDDVPASPYRVRTIKFDPPATHFAKVYTFVQFWLLLGGSLWLLQAQKDLPRTLVLLGYGWLCFSMFVQGAWLESRALAKRLEWLRLGLAAMITASAYLLYGEPVVAASVVSIGYVIFSALFSSLDLVLPTRRIA